jgi:hypothetical protein
MALDVSWFENLNDIPLDRIYLRGNVVVMPNGTIVPPVFGENLLSFDSNNNMGEFEVNIQGDIAFRRLVNGRWER